MSRRVTVELRTDGETIVEELDASLLATDDAVVDMARRQAEISTADFDRGEVVP